MTNNERNGTNSVCSLLFVPCYCKKLIDGFLKIFRQLRVVAPHQDVRDGCVIPERAVAAALEAQPDIVTVLVIVANDRADVVQLVRGRDETHRPGRVLEMREVIFLAIAPRQFFFRMLDQAVAATEHDLPNRITEARAEYLLEQSDEKSSRHSTPSYS